MPGSRGQPVLRSMAQSQVWDDGRKVAFLRGPFERISRERVHSQAMRRLCEVKHVTAKGSKSS